MIRKTTVLKRCPFCGYKGELIRDFAPASWGVKNSYMVECSNEKCLMHPQTGVCSDRRNVIQMWNRRRTTKDIDARMVDVGVNTQPKVCHNGTAVGPLTAVCSDCPLQYVCRGPSIFNTMACRGARSQLRERQVDHPAPQEKPCKHSRVNTVRIGSEYIDVCVDCDKHV